MSDNLSFDEFMMNMAQRSKGVTRHASRDAHRVRRRILENDIPVVEVSDEILERRKKYREDYVLAHREVFPKSTGVKPYGKEQEKAIRRFHRIVHSRGKLVQVEPRGYGKTSRAVNQLLLAILEGDVRFALVVSSATDKAKEIMEQIATELTTNDVLMELYPAVSACFRAIEGNPARAPRQTYNGEFTKITITKDTIIFPTIPGEPCSGAKILVKTKDNIRGLSARNKAGEDAGSIMRPDFVLLDDIQTDKEAGSAEVSAKIAKTIKRSIMFGGSHNKKVRVVLTITPNAKDDVAAHFVYKEQSWEVARYSMVPKMPKYMKSRDDGGPSWDDFAAILLNFDKFKPGDREKAALRAKQYVIDNYDELHEGAQVSWDWAYEWDLPPDEAMEVSALHHAMILYYEEGEDAFNYECQCIFAEELVEDQPVKAPMGVILSRVSHLPVRTIPVSDNRIVTHIDCNQDLLTYMTCSSSKTLRASIIEYGTFPPQPGVSWKKGKIVRKISDIYPHINKEDVRTLLYTALKEFVPKILEKIYIREDSSEMMHNLVGIDSRWEGDTVARVVRESNQRPLLTTVQGISLMARDKPMAEMTSSGEREYHYLCYSAMSSDRTVPVLRNDVNSLKTLVHKGFITAPGSIGSIQMYKPQYPGEHQMLVEHIISEKTRKDHYNKENRTIDVWEQVSNRDNEYFDNLVGCMGLLFKLGTDLIDRRDQGGISIDMQEYMRQQKKHVNEW